MYCKFSRKVVFITSLDIDDGNDDYGIDEDMIDLI